MHIRAARAMRARQVNHGTRLKPHAAGLCRSSQLHRKMPAGQPRLADQTGVLEVFDQPALSEEVENYQGREENQHAGLLEGVKGHVGSDRHTVPAADAIQQGLLVGVDEGCRQLGGQMRTFRIEVTGVVGVAVVPHEGQDGDDHDGGDGVGHHDLVVGTVETAAVDQGRFLQLLGDVLEELGEDQDHQALVHAVAQQSHHVQGGRLVDQHDHAFLARHGMLQPCCIREDLLQQGYQAQAVKVGEVDVLRQQQGLTGRQEHQDDQHEHHRAEPLILHAGHGVAGHGGDEHLNDHQHQCKADGLDHGHEAFGHGHAGRRGEGQGAPLLGDPDDVRVAQIFQRGKHRWHQLDEGIQDHEAQAQDQDDADEVE